MPLDLAPRPPSSSPSLAPSLSLPARQQPEGALLKKTAMGNCGQAFGVLGVDEKLLQQQPS